MKHEYERLKDVVLFFLVIAAVLSAVWLANANTRATVDSVRSGDKELWCNFKDGYRQADRSKIVDFLDERNAWVFTNGSASSCEVK